MCSSAVRAVGAPKPVQPQREIAPEGFPPEETKKGGCYRSTDRAIIVARRSWREISWGKTSGFPQRKKKEQKRKKGGPVETDALWKPWKNRRAQEIFPPFPQRWK